MTKLKFTKMHGCGNDYIYINCLEGEIENPENLAISLSDRHFGIGGDGLVLICKSDIADAKMRMFNMDGSEGKMCGNDIRCVAKYLYDNDICKKSEIRIETLSGIKTLQIDADNGRVASVKVDMGKAELCPSKIPVALPGDRIINAPLTVLGITYGITCVSMGNPHAVVFCEDPDGLDLEKIGPCFEHHEIFPERVNTEFVQILDKNTLKMRVWERGSGETLACGTGACASVVAATLNGYCEKGQDVRVILKGGDLTINYTDERVLMTGGCVKVFEGVIEV
jgi:diaminopimelate epimerase